MDDFNLKFIEGIAVVRKNITFGYLSEKFHLGNKMK